MRRRQRKHLPIFAHRREILYAVERFPVVILVGDTGSGKSTQIPQYLHEAGWSAGGRVVGCTQPTRIAASTVALRVANERGTRFGEEVGFAARFGKKCNVRLTRIMYMTDGHLLREMMLDPLLKKYSVIVIDEAHERSVHTDAVLGLLRKIRLKRPELRLVIASATLSVDLMRSFFERGKRNKGCTTVLSIGGRMHTVDVLYLDQPTPNYMEKAVETIVSIHCRERAGAILVFMASVEEVNFVARGLRDRQPSDGQSQWSVIRLHDSMSFRQQMNVFEPTRDQNIRKIIVATNIAEASITIPNVRYVVDSLFAKLPVYDPVSARESLITQPISKASAIQRAGRAGRMQYGKAYRLCTESAFESLQRSSVPEMQRANLAWIVLEIKALGIEDVLHFDFPSPPPAVALADGLEMLFALGAIDEYGKLTNPLGLHMAEFPVEPRLSKMLLSSFRHGCSEEAMVVVAMTTTRDIFQRPGRLAKRRADHDYDTCMRNFSDPTGDHMTLLRVFNGFIDSRCDRKWCEDNFLNFRALTYALEVRDQLRRFLKRFKPNENEAFASCGEDDKDAVLKCLSEGFFCNAASLMPSGNYLTVRGQREVVVDPTSALHMHSKVPHWIIFQDIVYTTREYVRDVSVLNPLWLCEIAPHFYEMKDQSRVGADSGTKRKAPASAAAAGGAPPSAMGKDPLMSLF